jgi:HEAT repeat protein
MKPQSQHSWYVAVVILAAGLITGAIIHLATCARPQEPTYGGRRLREWAADFQNLRNEDKEAHQRAGQAIRHIGTNALPWLLAWMSYEQPAWQTRLQGALRPCSALLQRLHLGWILSNARTARAGIAQTAFEALGPAASPAINELTRRMNQPHGGEASERAAWAFMYIGKGAFMALLPELDDPRVRWKLPAEEAIRTMGSSLGADGSKAVPSLIRNLDDADETVAAEAAWALGNIKVDAPIVVPILATVAGNTNKTRWVRVKAIQSLGLFGTEAGSSVPTLVRCLEDTNWLVAMSAGLSLGAIRLEPQSVIPALTKAARNDHFRIRQGAVRGLRQFGARARSSLPTILDLLGDPEPDVRAEATNALLEMPP